MCVYVCVCLVGWLEDIVRNRIYILVRRGVHVYVCVCMCVYICICVCVYMYVCVFGWREDIVINRVVLMRMMIIVIYHVRMYVMITLKMNNKKYEMKISSRSKSNHHHHHRHHHRQVRIHTPTHHHHVPTYAMTRGGVWSSVCMGDDEAVKGLNSLVIIIPISRRFPRMYRVYVRVLTVFDCYDRCHHCVHTLPHPCMHIYITLHAYKVSGSADCCCCWSRVCFEMHRMMMMT